MCISSLTLCAYRIAGSETTATFLSGATYYLCRTPHAYMKLVDEIRSNFTAYNEITGRTTEHCPYLKAVIDEGLRVYPPAALGLPRVSPGETVDGIFIPEGVCVSLISGLLEVDADFSRWRSTPVPGPPPTQKLISIALTIFCRNVGWTKIAPTRRKPVNRFLSARVCVLVGSEFDVLFHTQHRDICL